MYKRLTERLTARPSLTILLEKLGTFRENNFLQNFGALLIVISGPTLAIFTLFYLNIVEQEMRPQWVRIIIFADVLYVIVIA